MNPLLVVKKRLEEIETDAIVRSHFEFNGATTLLETVNRVFPKVDHSANVARIVLDEYTIGSVGGLNFC